MSKPTRLFTWDEIKAALAEVYGYEILQCQASLGLANLNGMIQIGSPGVMVVYEDPLHRNVQQFLKEHDKKEVSGEADSADGGDGRSDSVHLSTDGI